jgi:hypothetical protein
MKAVCSPKTSVRSYKFTRRYNLKTDIDFTECSFFLAAALTFLSFNFTTNFESVSTWNSPVFLYLLCHIFEMELMNVLLAADTSGVRGTSCVSFAISFEFTAQAVAACGSVIMRGSTSGTSVYARTVPGEHYKFRKLIRIEMKYATALQPTCTISHSSSTMPPNSTVFRPFRGFLRTYILQASL